MIVSFILETLTCDCQKILLVTNDEMLVPLWAQRENKIILPTNLTPYVSQGVEPHRKFPFDIVQSAQGVS